MDVLEKMATYVRVVEAGSFSAAAKQLRISPAAVSRQISTLEDELRVPLFRRVLVAAPAYLKKGGEPRTPEALAKHDALAYPSGDALDSWIIVHQEREARVRLNAVFRSNAPSALRALAIDGAGIAMLPAWLVDEDLQRRALRLVLPGWETEPVAVHALHRRRSEERRVGKEGRSRGAP